MIELNWDKDFALEQSAEDAELLNELLLIFKDSSRKDLDLIKQGVEAGNSDQVASAAHSMKGAAASLGMTGLNSVARSIEEDSRNGNLDQARDLLPNLEYLLDKVDEL